jgi:hypothetical protein
MDSSDPKAAKLLSRLLKIEIQEPVISIMILVNANANAQEKSHLKRDEILLEYLSRNEEKIAHDGAKDKILVEQTVPAEPERVVPKDPDPEPQPKLETEQMVRAVTPPPRAFLSHDGPCKGPLAHLYNSIGLNEYGPEPEIQPTSDDTFLESIQSGTRSPTVPEIATKSSSRTNVAADVKHHKSLAENLVEKKERKFDSHGIVPKNTSTIPSSPTETEMMKKLKGKVDGTGDVVVAHSVRDDGNLSQFFPI